MEGHRAERVAEALREELAEIINYELTDPRLQTVAVTEVLLPPGARQAHIRLSIPGTTAEQKQSLEIIQRASGLIRQIVAERVDVFRLPELKFFADLSPETRAKSATLLRKIRRGRPRPDPAATPDSTPPEKNSPK